MVFHWSLSDSKFPHVSRTFQSIQADLNSAVVWMVSSDIQSPPVPFSTAPTRNVIIVTFMFHSFFFFSFLARSKYLSIFLLSFIFILWSAGTARSTSFFFLFSTRSGLLAEIEWSVYISNSQRIFGIPFSRTDSSLCIYNFNLLHFPTRP